MRLFVSLPLPLEVIREVEKIQKALPFFEGKKIKPENLHLTLKFLGDVKESKLEEIKSRLSSINSFSFDAKLGEIGVFSEREIRIVWIAVSCCEELQKEVDASLENIFKKEERFMGHLTIARVKNVKNKNSFLKEIKNISYSNLNFKVNSFNLMKSILNSKEPAYSIIKSYSLKKRTYP